MSVQEQQRLYLALVASDGAAHDEAMPPDSTVPLGADALDFHILKASILEPLYAVKQCQSEHQSAAVCAGLLRAISTWRKPQPEHCLYHAQQSIVPC